jgi:tRNA (guanine26-N2/guanine27-N2)-dimethyltransferase
MTASKTGLLATCSGCKSYSIQNLGKYESFGNGKNKRAAPATIAIKPECDNCGFVNHISGPFYIGELHNPAFLQQIIAHTSQNKDNYGTYDRMIGMLTVISEVELLI